MLFGSTKRKEFLSFLERKNRALNDFLFNIKAKPTIDFENHWLKFLHKHFIWNGKQFSIFWFAYYGEERIKEGFWEIFCLDEPEKDIERSKNLSDILKFMKEIANSFC